MLRKSLSLKVDIFSTKHNKKKITNIMIVDDNQFI